jgi:hypothetical protein
VTDLILWYDVGKQRADAGSAMEMFVTTEMWKARRTRKKQKKKERPSQRQDAWAKRKKPNAARALARLALR